MYNQPTENQHPGLTLAAAIKALEILETQPAISKPTAVLGAVIGVVAVVGGMVLTLKYGAGADVVKSLVELIKEQVPTQEKVNRLEAVAVLFGTLGLPGAIGGWLAQRDISTLLQKRKFKKENTDKMEGAFKALKALTQKRMIGAYPVEGGGVTFLNTSTYDKLERTGAETMFVEPGRRISVSLVANTDQDIKPESIRDCRIVPIRAVHLSWPFKKEYNPRIKELVETTKQMRQARAASIL